MQTETLIATLQNLLDVAPQEYETDIRSTIETLTGFEIIFAEGLDDADDQVALFDSIEDARELLNDIEWDLRLVDWGLVQQARLAL